MTTAVRTHLTQVDVTGGVGGIEARLGEIHAAAGAFGAAATECLGATFTLHGYLAHPGLTASALLDPSGWAAFELDLVDALDGPRGLSWLGAAFGVIDGELRAAALTYGAVDRLSGEVHDQIFGMLGLPLAMAQASAVLVRTGDPLLAAQSALATDPELADTVIDELGVPQALAIGARYLPDGHGVVRDLGREVDDDATRPPRRLTDIVDELARRNADEHHGAVDVRIVTLADGSRRAIVDITGTKSWSLMPTSDVTSLTTNGRAIAGEPTAYEQGVLDAMTRAGVGPTEPVMFVGHSEGGLVAVNAARDAVNSGRFRVTHVVTAGAPIGRIAGDVPSSVRVLALENSRDVVPHLDGRANPETRNVTTASSGYGDGTIGDNHSIEHGYLPLARDVEASSDVSIRDFLDSAGGFLSGTHASTHAYQIRRRY